MPHERFEGVFHMNVLHNLYQHKCSLQSIKSILRHRHVPTHMHCERVVLMADLFGNACAFSHEEHQKLLYSAMLHDIGKIGIPDNILMFDGPLNDTQREIMQLHSTTGETIVRMMQLENGEEIALQVRHHHEHYDGNGYPDRLALKAIPLHARILSILDSYDALREERHYRSSLSHEAAVTIMQNESGTKHDPELLDIFLGLEAIKMIGDDYNKKNNR
jgi:HD-GYP domain-containing protein (c-di-GMP phosphodiesterase class II)